MIGGPDYENTFKKACECGYMVVFALTKTGMDVSVEVFYFVKIGTDIPAQWELVNFRPSKSMHHLEGS